ncbi:MAG TPA: M28 family peptidase [Gemmatimonadaceae bacterium]|nr:M28 family peptidase [Gemmatimonadaceae bacterium]
MKLILSILSTGLVAVASVAPAQHAHHGQGAPLPLKMAPQKTTPAITTADLMTRVYQFADDSMRGRMAGSPEAMKGTEYIARELERLGLQPAGENGTYFQDVPLGVQTLDSASTLTVDGKTLRAGADFLANGQLGVAPLSRTLEVMYGGHAIDTTNVLSPDQVRGKLLVLLPPTQQPTNVQALLASEGYKRYAAALSAAGAIATIGGPQIPPAAARNAFTPSSFVQLIPDQAPAAGMFLQVTQSAGEALLGGSPASMTKGAAGKSVNASVRFTLTRRPGRNVIAVVPGRDARLKGQYVAIGAHSDHVGTRGAGGVDHDSMRVFNSVVRPQGADSPNRPANTDEAARIRALTDSLRAAHPARRDSINNGADDDASGSMGVLEIAEAFASANEKPRRSLLFVWHIGEEEGMLGSRYFTDHPTVPRDSIVAQLNVDMIGRGGTKDVTGESKAGELLYGRDEGYLQLIGSRRLSTQLGDLVEDVNKATNAGFKFDYGLDADGHQQNIYCRSDHYMYARYGIPIVFFTTGGHLDYHQVTDEPQYINYDQLRRATQLIHDVAGRVADLDQRPVVDKPKPDPQGGCRQ